MFRQKAGVAIAILISIVTVAGNAYGQEYPTKPIRLVVPWPAGGVTDVVARIVGERLGNELGKPMVIDNRAGASGFIGTVIVAKAPADGYTLLLVTSSTHAASPAVFRKIPYDPLKDFATISQVTLAPTILVVPPSLAANSVAELVTLAKAKPKQLDYASYGNGSTAHLAAELFLQTTGASMMHVPYKGAAPAVTDLIGGHVHMFFDSIPSSLPHVRSGKLKALAVTGPTRAPAAPDIPTVAESYPGFQVTVWQGFQAPAGTPRAIIDKLNANILKVMAMPDVRERLTNLGADPVSSTPEQFAQHIAREKQKWADVVKRAGIPQVD
ncbi:MAG: tripartite tricarboxylate transporter substrate binding protein [Betaproteobacteria bacterium]|nr:tripartite tricarboxylate transporter substrate binding protein [Betaproteobacteria bacterium]MBI2291110.1 tripartite tricarboxylate transporter substrate binding protein [Betaproteobacteria bacterium]MBI3056527.1 tripartite tricarboxylate transporter substrate binding protein [Betaproteobacteria bacterium]